MSSYEGLCPDCQQVECDEACMKAASNVKQLALPSPLSLTLSVTDRARVYAYTRACVAHATAAKDAELVERSSTIEALRAEVDEWRQAAITQSGEMFREKDRAERLAEAGRRVTAAFRAHGETTPFTREADRTRHECEAAMLALDAALHPTAAQENDDEQND